MSASTPAITADSKCVGCEGLTSSLPPSQVDTHLQTLLPEWATNADRTQLHRTLKLRNFRGAMAYINRIAELAEAEGHHPDMTVRSWNVVDVVLWTHKTGGVTDNDVIMAVKIDAMSPVVEK